MRTMLVLAGSALGIFVAAHAAAQDTPATPPDTPSPPAETPSPPPEPAPAPAPSAPPRVVLPETPEAPPAKPPPKQVAPADVTLDESPDEPLPKKAGKVRPAKKPHPQAEPPPEKQPETAPAPTAEHPSKPPTEKPEGGDDSKSKKNKDDGEGLLGPFRIGIILGAGLPSIFSFGGMIKLTRYFGAGINIGLIPAIKLAYYGEAELSYQEYDIYGRLFPFGGAFFAGAGVGYANIAGSFKSTFDIPPVQGQNLPPSALFASDASVRTLVLIPTIGLLHTFGSGFTIGIDAGAQIPIAPSENRFETSMSPVPPPNIQAQYIDPYKQQVEGQVRDTLDTMSRTIIPTLNLRIGWLL